MMYLYNDGKQVPWCILLRPRLQTKPRPAVIFSAVVVVKDSFKSDDDAATTLVDP